MFGKQANMATMLDFLFRHTNFLIDLVLAFITMSLGLGLSKDDFKNLFTAPKALTIGLIAQMLLLPIAAFVLMWFSHFSPAIKVGFMILSFCPGGVTSNLVSFILKGNVALSISLTVLNALLCMFTIPILVNVSLNYFMGSAQSISLPIGKTIAHIALVTVLPAIIGVFIKHKFQAIADKIQPVLKYLLPTLLFLIFAIKFFAPSDKGGITPTSAEILTLGIWGLILNFSSMALGYFSGSVFKINLQNRVTFMIEIGLHNTALALLIAGNILHNTEMQKPALVYAIFTFFSTLFFAWLIRLIALKFKVK